MLEGRIKSRRRIAEDSRKTTRWSIWVVALALVDVVVTVAVLIVVVLIFLKAVIVVVLVADFVYLL